MPTPADEPPERSAPLSADPKRRPVGVVRAALNRRALICVFTGLASGLPLYILVSLVPAWLRIEGIGLVEIGLFATVSSLPYTWKFLWAPVMDRYLPPKFARLGRRRSWMLLTQLAMFPCIAALPLVDLERELWTAAALCAAIAWLSASQDIALDAYRRELLPDRELGFGNSMHVNAYRVSGLVPGSLALVLADHISWNAVFAVTAGFLAIAVGLTLSVREISEPSPARGLRDAVVEPLREFFGRAGAGHAWLALSFICLYKFGDNMATVLATPFYLDLGFSPTEIGAVAKNAALWPSVIGGILGGLWMIRIGINRALWLFGAVQLASIFGFAWLAQVGHNLWLLAGVIAFEYLGVGLGTAAFVAFIARATSLAHAATQFALLTALASLPRTLSNALTGALAEQLGWTAFFYLCAALALPGMLLLLKVAPWSEGAHGAGALKA